MKRIFFIALINAGTVLCFGQYSQVSMVASATAVDRMSMAKSSIEVPSWHEKSFWPLYEKYLAKVEGVAFNTYRTVDELAKTDNTAGEQEAFDRAKKLLDLQYEELALRKEYFTEIANGFNGVIALQFLQTETLLDVIESAGVYEQTSWKRFRFVPKAVSGEHLIAARQNTAANALGITPEQAHDFWNVFNRYQDESDALLGEDYGVFGLYVGNASDFTPAFAKRLGRDFLIIIERELKLKEKYFLEMNAVMGPLLAARFLAWADYSSVVNKMYTWAENQ